MEMNARFSRTLFMVAVIFSLHLATAASTVAQTWSNSYAYRRAITIDYTKVPNTDRTNFPVLISGTYSYLATIANGGDATNANGYDIIFTSDSAGTVNLPYERESYSASTGAVVFWVQVPTVSHTQDTVIYMFYGNGAITTDQSNKTGVWDSNYIGVWHLNQNPTSSAPQMSDSTSNANNGTAQGTWTTAQEIAGKISGGLSFVSSNSDYLSTTKSFSNPGSETLQIWCER
jgi:hypothetical protein